MDEKKQGGLGAPSGYSAGSEGAPGRDLSDDERRRFESGYSAMPEEVPPGGAISEPSDIGDEPRAASAPITEPIDIDIRTHPTGTVMAGPAEGRPSEPKGDGATAKRAVDRAVETAQHGADTAREVAADRIEQMSSKVEEQISDKAAEYVGTVTGMVKHYMQNAAETLRTKSTDDLMQMGRDQIRERPLVFAAGAFAVGFICTRFLKS